METAIAGDFGVPLVLMTGDSAGCLEAEELVKGVKTVAVKESLGESAGRCLPLSVTTEQIRGVAAAVAGRPPASEPWDCGPDLTLEVSFHAGPYAEAIRREYAADVDDSGAMVLHGRTATAVWADYWQRRLRCEGLLHARA